MQKMGDLLQSLLYKNFVSSIKVKVYRILQLTNTQLIVLIEKKKVI